MEYRNNIDDRYNTEIVLKSNKRKIIDIIQNIYDLPEINNKENNTDVFKYLGAGTYAYAYLLKNYNIVAKMYKRKSKYKPTIIENYDKIKYAIDSKICPNFIYLYDHLDDPFCLLLEYADGTLKTFLECFSEFKLNYNILESIIIQLLIGILCMQKNLNMFHGSLGLVNIFYKNIHPETILYYNINGVLYEIKTYGILIMIADVDTGVSYPRTTKNLDFNNIDLRTQYNLLIKSQLANLYAAHGIPLDTSKDALKRPDIYSNLVTSGLITESIYSNACKIYADTLKTNKRKHASIANMMAYIIKNIDEKLLCEYIGTAELCETYQRYTTLINTIFIESYNIPIERILREQFGAYICNIRDISDISEKNIFTINFRSDVPTLIGGDINNYLKYKTKYLKYKTKYLNLKKLFFSNNI
jgi:hypothetical protein